MSGNAKMSKQHKRIKNARRGICYIIAPVGARLDEIKRLLRERRIEPVVSFELPVGGFGASESVKKVIRNARLCIALLGKEPYDANVLYELGIAKGLGKRVLVIEPPGLGKLPVELGGFVSIKSEPEASGAISFALDRVLGANKIREPILTARSLSKPIGELSDFFLSQISPEHQPINGRFLIDIVAKALAESGVTTIVYAQTAEAETDLAIWSDDLEGWTGNPLIVEVKLSIAGFSQALEVAQGLERYLTQSNARFALVLYLNGGPLAPRVSSSPVFFVEIRELLRLLRTKGFGQIIRELRNKWAHSG